jgi:hypothetical protein
MTDTSYMFAETKGAGAQAPTLFLMHGTGFSCTAPVVTRTSSSV